MQNQPKSEPKNDACVCRRCGRKLKNPIYIELGMGKTCYQKFMSEKIIKPLFSVTKHEGE